MSDDASRRINIKPFMDGQPKSWRMVLGTWMFVIPFVMFLGAPLAIPILGLSASQGAATVGGIIVVAEVIWFASIPLLGKQGFLDMKTKAFAMLKLQTGPVSKSRHQAGSWLFCIGLGGQLLLHALMIVAYALLGDDADTLILGLNFSQQLAVYFTSLILLVIALVIGIYLLGADFAERCRTLLSQHVQ